jgi:hypothetical protein
MSIIQDIHHKLLFGFYWDEQDLSSIAFGVNMMCFI